MKMSQILNLMSLYENVKNYKLPLKTAYKFNKVASALEEEKKFYQNKFNQIIAEYGKTDENGQYVLTEDQTSITIKDGKEEECRKAIEELQNLEVTLPQIKFTLEELESIALSVQEIGYLMPLIEE